MALLAIDTNKTGADRKMRIKQGAPMAHTAAYVGDIGDGSEIEAVSNQFEKI